MVEAATVDRVLGRYEAKVPLKNVVLQGKQSEQRLGVLNAEEGSRAVRLERG